MTTKNKVVENIMVVEKINNPIVIEFRKSKCGPCPKNVDGSCLECGCILDVKWRSLTNRTLNNIGLPLGPIQRTHCPLGKWNDKPTANLYRGLKGLPMID